MKLHAVMVTKNEADRYLQPVLEHLSKQVDSIFVYDDCSLDRTIEIVEQYTDTWELRPDCLDSFLDDESHFRQNAYEMFEDVVEPNKGDFVLSIDADEMLVEDFPNQLREYLASTSYHPDREPKYALNVAEVFDVVDGVPMVRIDGFWGGIKQDRIFRWNGDVRMNDRTMACGSVPKWALNAPLLAGPSILHYGYAREEDRVTKYARYIGVPGHNVKHVDSIRRRPTLMAWDGPVLEGVT